MQGECCLADQSPLGGPHRSATSPFPSLKLLEKSGVMFFGELQHSFQAVEKLDSNGVEGLNHNLHRAGAKE